MNQISEVFVITGCSRGVGAALFQLAQQPGRALLGMARQVSAELKTIPTSADASVEAWTVDLSDAAGIAKRMRDWLLRDRHVTALRWVLINNAALLEAPGDLATQTSEQISAVLRVGVEAPMLLASAMLSARDVLSSQGCAPRVQIMNVSSGLGRRAMAGTATYCAAKAGLDHFSRALALEEATKPEGARVVSIAPGVIDTDMQQQLRSASPDMFVAQQDFASLHASGRLATSEQTATQLLEWLQRADFGKEVVCDIRTQ